MDAHSTHTTGRAMCYRCFKVAAACVCGDIQRVENRTGVIVLQHPRERRHPFGTARFARLGLERVELRVCSPKSPEALARASVLPPDTAFLYPSPGARDVEDIPPGERPAHIVVVDGTWQHAHSILHAAPWLRTLPCVRVTPRQPSEYRVRREPRAECLSTIEAIVATLRALEPDTQGLDGLLDAFRAMIDRQVAAFPYVPLPKPRPRSASQRPDTAIG